MCTLAEKTDLETLVGRLLKQSALGGILESVGHKEKEVLTYCYLTDFVHMVYKPRSDNPQMELEVFELLTRSP